MTEALQQNYQIESPGVATGTCSCKRAMLHVYQNLSLWFYVTVVCPKTVTLYLLFFLQITLDETVILELCLIKGWTRKCKIKIIRSTKLNSSEHR